MPIAQVVEQMIHKVRQGDATGLLVQPRDPDNDIPADYGCTKLNILISADFISW